MKKDLIESREKEFIALQKRRNEILDIKRGLPWRKLDKPIQDGWIINIRLIEEALKRSDGPRMAAAVAMCDRDFTLRKNNGGKISNLRKDTRFNHMRQHFMYTDYRGVTTYGGPSLYPISEKTYKELGDDMKKFFTRVEKERFMRWGGQRHVDVSYVCNVADHYFTIHIKKRMLTMIQDLDPEILKEEAFIEDKMDLMTHEGVGPWSRYSDWRDRDTLPKNMRRHSKDGIKKFIKGDLESPSDYRKLSKQKSKI